MAGGLIMINAALPAFAEAPIASALSDRGTVLSQVTVLIEGFRNDRGDALLALFRVAGDFPEQPERAERRELTKIVDGKARIVLSGLQPGVFALSVLHDEDGDRKLKTGLFGIPREGIGFSRNARGTFGPPKFDSARLSLQPGVNLTVSIRMHYY
jgi:uncharacterized protein (DUF2141 family)